MARDCLRAVAARQAQPLPPFRAEDQSSGQTGSRRSSEASADGAPATAPAQVKIASQWSSGRFASAELAPDDVFAAQVGLLAEIECPRHGGPHAVRGRPCRSPAIRHRHHFVPVVGALRDVGGIVEIIELAGIFGYAYIGLVVLVE